MSAPRISVRVRQPRKARDHFLRGLKLRVRRIVSRLSSWQWALILGGIVVPPLFALAFSSAASSQGGNLAAAPPAEEAPRGAWHDLSEGTCDDLVDPGTPGDFLSDLTRAFEEGDSSGLVNLAGREEEHHFEKLREASRRRAGRNGLGFFRIEKGRDGVEVYEVRAGQGKTLGVVMVKPIQGRWQIVGAAESAEGARASARSQKASAEHITSTLNSMLEHRDEDVRRAAAEALERLRREEEGASSGSISGKGRGPGSGAAAGEGRTSR